MLDSALQWVDRGFPIFPLKPRDKVPLGYLVPRGLKDASRDSAVIRNWWRLEPMANIGLRTGNGKFVLDLDGESAVAWFANSCGRHESTLTIRTSRGWHLYFESSTDIPCSTGRISPHVDVRGVGGYVVAPPSVHPSGAVYTIDKDLPIATAPQWLIDEALPNSVPRPVATIHLEPSDRGLGRIAGIISLVVSAKKGERNRLTFWAACRLDEMVRDGLMTQGLATDLLREAGARCGLDDREIIRTVVSATRQRRGS
jgi:hypothetical protein